MLTNRDVYKLLKENIKTFKTKNSSDWFNSNELKYLYSNTTGPYNSPDPVECYILNFLAEHVGGNVLEFGSWKGRSASFLSSGIKNSQKTDRKLTCIDWFEGDNTGGNMPDKQTMINTLTNFNLLKYVEIIDKNMLLISYNEILNNIDLVFYDADHNVEPTTTTLNKIYPFINEGCLVVMHDANFKTTKIAIEKISDKYNHIITLNVWEGLAILIKK